VIRSHLLNLVVYSAIVAAVFAVLLKRERASRLRFGGIVFGAFVLSALFAGWLMAHVAD
jgi:hypothetical protein